MPKKRGSSGSSNKTKKSVDDSITKNLAKNIIELQKVHLDMAEKFDSLSKQLSTLLKLFESAAKSFAQNPIVQASEKDREFLDKIDKLLDQNKTIARGLTLMEDRVREKIHHDSPPPYQAPGQAPMQASQQAHTMESGQYGEDHFRPSSTGKPLPRF
tara:strand:+ start:4548 stop:5018 length:471 start_codon:yes stop_codon:yes gene_type:complete